MKLVRPGARIFALIGLATVTTGVLAGTAYADSVKSADGQPGNGQADCRYGLWLPLGGDTCRSMQGHSFDRGRNAHGGDGQDATGGMHGKNGEDDHYFGADS